EVRLSAGLLDRPHLDARTLHVQEEHGEALVLGYIGIGAREQNAVIGIMRARGPDLLAVNDPVIAFLLRARAQPRDVGTAGRLREQLAPDLLAGGQRRQIFAFLLCAGKRHHRGTAHTVADDEHRAEFAERTFLLLPDHALDRRGAAAAILLRPLQA